MVNDGIFVLLRWGGPGGSGCGGGGRVRHDVSEPKEGRGSVESLKCAHQGRRFLWEGRGGGLSELSAKSRVGCVTGEEVYLE